MDEAAEVLQRYLAAWNGQDGDGLAALYHEDAERASPLGTARGGAASSGGARRIYAAVGMAVQTAAS